MSRLDWKRGRFSSDAETDRIFKGMRGWRDVFGDWITYYHYDGATSVMNEVYDEAEGPGKRYFPPIRIPAQHVVHIEGGNKNEDSGFYFNDTLSATFSYDLFNKVGLEHADILTGQYLKDRVIYDRKVFRVTVLRIEGQIQQRDIIVQMEATQVKPDELVDDPEFKAWSA